MTDHLREVTKMIYGVGHYPNVPEEIYHGQLTPTPSVSSSMLRDIEEFCPLKAWHNCYLNPDREVENSKEFDIGTATHLAMLEPDLLAGQIDVLAFDNYRTKAAQEAKEWAYAGGKTPLLQKQFDQIVSMRKALNDHKLTKGVFVGGASEQTYISVDRITGLYLKARIDYVCSNSAYLVDLKSTTNAKPSKFERAVADNGYYMQAAHYCDVYTAATGIEVRNFFFVTIEKDAPHLLSVCALNGDALDYGRKKNRRALDTFARCLATGHWEDYGDTVHYIGLPQWELTRLKQEEEDGGFKPKPMSKDLLRKLYEWQAPQKLEGK